MRTSESYLIYLHYLQFQVEMFNLHFCLIVNRMSTLVIWASVDEQMLMVACWIQDVIVTVAQSPLQLTPCSLVESVRALSPQVLSDRV